MLGLCSIQAQSTAQLLLLYCLYCMKLSIQACRFFQGLQHVRERGDHLQQLQWWTLLRLVLQLALSVGVTSWEGTLAPAQEAKGQFGVLCTARQCFLSSTCFHLLRAFILLTYLEGTYIQGAEAASTRQTRQQCSMRAQPRSVGASQKAYPSRGIIQVVLITAEKIISTCWVVMAVSHEGKSARVLCCPYAAS